MQQARWACIVSLSAALLSAPALACGYHNPSDVARGVMNFVYPKSLYVRSAVWQAQRSGLLPSRKTRRARDLFAYQHTASNLQKLASRLSPLTEEKSGFSVVLLDTMLWARFIPAGTAYQARVHVSGPKRGDAVLVSEAPVIASLAKGTLDVAHAEEAGLFRLYGPLGRQAAVRAALSGLAEPLTKAAPSMPRTKGQAG